ncbi:hypothetical protein [Microbulbifer sp. JMSA003]|uniref:hypothetical protein n=1 Tax=Microbulbifer sp. JMSA003 TaxID=3243369 RepID=UPI00403921D3
MSNLLFYKGYRGSVETDPDEGFLYGKVLYVEDLISYQAENIKSLNVAFVEAVDDYLADCKRLNISPCDPCDTAGGKQ